MLEAVSAGGELGVEEAESGVVVPLSDCVELALLLSFPESDAFASGTGVMIESVEVAVATSGSPFESIAFTWVSTICWI